MFFQIGPIGGSKLKMGDVCQNQGHRGNHSIRLNELSKGMIKRSRGTGYGVILKPPPKAN